MADTITRHCATGRRKTATAQARLTAGNGKITVNHRPFENYFPTEALQRTVREPFTVSATEGKFDASLTLKGGGPSGHADAARHAISRALLLADANLRPALKSAGFLTRDSRMRERKKYGQPGARKRFQFSKR
jgi:small subunit ribosomal protein S9